MGTIIITFLWNLFKISSKVQSSGCVTKMKPAAVLMLSFHLTSVIAMQNGGDFTRNWNLPMLLRRNKYNGHMFWLRAMKKKLRHQMKLYCPPSPHFQRWENTNVAFPEVIKAGSKILVCLTDKTAEAVVLSLEDVTLNFDFNLLSSIIETVRHWSNVQRGTQWPYLTQTVPCYFTMLALGFYWFCPLRPPEFDAMFFGKSVIDVELHAVFTLPTWFNNFSLFTLCVAEAQTIATERL